MPEDIRGLYLIGEMTKAQLVEEALAYVRTGLERMGTAELKSMIIDYRVATVRERLESEANISVQRGLFGTQVEEKE